VAGKTRAKRILFPLGEKELSSVQERLLHIPLRLAKAGFSVDIVTYKKDLYEKAESFFKDAANITLKLMKSMPLVWSPQQRDDFVKIFIKHTFDLYIPGTDMKYWKTAAFDDFRGHVSSHAFSGLEGSYDLLLMPVPSSDEPPSTDCDVFYSTVVFFAKENNIATAGMQIYPISHTPLIFLRAFDYFIVKETFEKEYYVNHGIEDDRIFILDAHEENYCLSTVEDTYKNLMFSDQISIERDEIGVLIVNHSKFRPQIKEIIEALSELNIKKSIFFQKRGYHIRELSEDQIVDELIRPVLAKAGGRHYIVQEGALVKVLMPCDVIIAPVYIIPLSFAVQHDKCSIVYNPLKKAMQFQDGVLFLNNKKSIMETVMAYFERKQNLTYISDIVKRITG